MCTLVILSVLFVHTEYNFWSSAHSVHSLHSLHSVHSVHECAQSAHGNECTQCAQNNLRVHEKCCFVCCVRTRLFQNNSVRVHTCFLCTPRHFCALLVQKYAVCTFCHEHSVHTRVSLSTLCTLCTPLLFSLFSFLFRAPLVQERQQQVASSKSTTRSLTFSSLIAGMVFSDWLALGRRQQ
jgi:hypothetical protein